MPTNASELVGDLCKFIMSIDHAETLEYVYLIPYNMYCLYTLFLFVIAPNAIHYFIGKNGLGALSLTQLA